MMVPTQRTSLTLFLVALCVAAPAAGAQGAQGGSAQRTEAEQRRIEQVRRDLERAVERARDRIDELREDSPYLQTESRAMRQAKIALERAEPMTPEFAAQLAKLEALAAQERPRFMEDQELKGALREMQRLQGELVVRRTPLRQRGYLGVTFQSERSVDRTGRISFTVEDYPSILSVDPESPAAQAGVKRGDVLLALNGRDLVSQGPIPLSDMLTPGQTVKMRVLRDRKKMEVPVKVGLAREVRVYSATPVAPTAPGGTTIYGPLPPVGTPAPPGTRVRVEPVRPRETTALPGVVWSSNGEGFGGGFNATFIGTTVMLGAQLQSMDRDQRDALDVDEGVLVIRVTPNTQWAESGLKSLDVLVRIDGALVRSPDEVRALVGRAKESGADSVVATVITKQKERKLTLRW